MNKTLHMITFVLLVVGGLNWGLVVLGWDIGMFIPSTVANIIYILVALSALYEIFTHKGRCKTCESKGGAAPATPTPPMGSSM